MRRSRNFCEWESNSDGFFGLVYFPEGKEDSNSTDMALQ